MIDIIQGSPEWHAIRAGKVTASKIADVMAKTKTGVSASRATYMGQLIAERLTGVVQNGYTNAAMDHGTTTEPEARAAYDFYTNHAVELIGFADHPLIAMSGASPDGLVGDDGLVEIKCPNTATHIETLLGGKVPTKYVYQMQWQMACTNRQWCDFVSYDPRMPEHMRVFVQRLPRDNGLITILEGEVLVFLDEVARKVAQLEALYAQKEAA